MDSTTPIETTQDTATMANTPKAKRARRRRGRRLNGEGTVYQRTDGRWCAEVSIGNGRKKSLYGKTAEEARAKLNATIAGIAQGHATGDDRLTLSTHLDAFLAERRARGCRASTMTDYTNVVTRHLKPGLGNVRVRKLSATEVQRFLDAKATEALSSTMVRHIRTILRMAMRLAVDRDLVVRNVVDSVRGPKSERAELVPLNLAETRTFLAAVRSHALGALWLIAGTVAMRRGELLGLQWANVDLDTGLVRVRVQLAHVEDDKGVKVPTLVEPKSKKAIRDLRISPVVIEALKARKSEQAAQRLKLGSAWRDTMGLVFTAEDGAPFVGASISALHTKLCGAAKVRGVRFHDLRHGAATLMLSSGVDVKTLSATLGHSRVGFTLDTYAHVTQDGLDDAVGRVATAVLPRSVATDA